MKTLVRVRFNNASHRFLERAAFDVRALDGEARLHGLSTRGEAWALLGEDVTRVRLALTFTLMETRQEAARRRGEMRVVAEGAEVATEVAGRWELFDEYRVRGGLLVWEPGAAPSATGAVPSSLHLRSSVRAVAPDAAALARGAGSVVVVDVDASFLDATGLRPDPGAWDDIDGCLVRLYQHTGVDGGSGCGVVAVALPPALRRGDAPGAVDSLVFFCPVSASYTDARDVNLHQLERYLGGRRDPAGSERFFGFRRYPGGPDAPSRFDTHPPCRFARQLRDSGRRVMLVVPQSNAGDYSPFSSGAWTRRRAPAPDALVDSLLKAVQADGHLAGARRGPRARRGRVGVGGFSIGGGFALDCFRANASRVDELHLYDPNDFEEGDPGRTAALAWARQPGRRLRLVGGMHAASLARFAREAAGALGADPDRAVDASHDRAPGAFHRDASVAVLPTSELFFHRSADYRAAYAASMDLRFTARGAAADGPLTEATGVYVEPTPAGDPLRFVARLPDGTFTAPETLSGPSHDEAVVMLVNAVGLEDPVRSAAQFRRVMGDARALMRRRPGIPQPQALRHQWAVFGGQGATGAHDGTFKGYFQLCLEASGFAR